MRSKRFIFTISNDQDEFLAQESQKNLASKSKIISLILEEHISQKRSNIIHTYKKEFDPNDNDSHTSQIVNNLLYLGDYEALINEIENNFDLLVRETDLDFLLYLTSQLSTLFPENNAVTISQAKILRQKGLLSESTSTLSLKNFGKDEFHKYIILAQISIAKGEISSALNYLNLAKVELNVWNTVNDYHSRKEEYVITKAEYLWIAEGVDSANKYIENFINTKGISNGSLGKAHCLQGDFLRDKGSYQEAELCYKNGLTLLENIPDGKYKARALRGLGSICKKNNDTVNATKYIFQALEVSKNYKDRITTGSILGSVGSLYQNLGEMSLAQGAFHEKYEIGSQAQSLREVFYANYDRAINLISRGENNSAITVLQETMNNANSFRRKYYLDIWDGYVLSCKDFDAGMKIIEKAKSEAFASSENRQIGIASYAIAVSTYLNNGRNNSDCFKVILNDPETSTQMKYNIQKILKGHKLILPI